MTTLLDNFDIKSFLKDYLLYNLLNSEEVKHVGEFLSCKYIAAEWNIPKKLGITVENIEETARELGLIVISTKCYGGMIDLRTYVAFGSASDEDKIKLNQLIKKLNIKCLYYKNSSMIIVKDFRSMNKIIQQETLKEIRCLPYKNKKTVWYPGNQNKENITTYVVCKDTYLIKVQQLMALEEIPVTVIKNQTVEGQFALIIGTSIVQVKTIIKNWIDIFTVIRPANKNLSKQDKFLLDFEKWTENITHNTNDAGKIENCLQRCLDI